MQTHPCFPLTPENETEYKRLNEAKAQLETETDPDERIKLINERGKASQNIRRIGMNNQLIPLALPKAQDIELERLRQRVRVLEMALTMLTNRVTVSEADQAWAQQIIKNGAISEVWQEASKDMVI